MRLFYAGLVLLMLAGCVLSKEHYESIRNLDSNYQSLEQRDKQLADELHEVKKGE